MWTRENRGLYERKGARCLGAAHEEHARALDDDRADADQRPVGIIVHGRPGHFRVKVWPT